MLLYPLNVYYIVYQYGTQFELRTSLAKQLHKNFYKFYFFRGRFLLSTIALFGISLNILCVIFFQEENSAKFRRKMQFSNIYLVLVECLTKLLVKCESCAFSKTYFMCILSLLTEDYFKQVFRML